MQQLHLVGFTTDHRGLIFSVRRGAKSGSYTVAVDERLFAAIDDARSWLAEALEAEGAHVSAPIDDRPQSQLSVREVQARLRQGMSIVEVAADAGVEASWVARFAAPVLTEQAEVIRAVRAARLVKRTGISGAPIGDAVYRNLAERGVTAPRDELDRHWSARQLIDGTWEITFNYVYRQRKQKARWSFDTSTGKVGARDRMASSLGFRPGGPPPKPPTRSRPAGSVVVTPATGEAAANKRDVLTQKRIAAARKEAAARMVAEAQRATKRDAAVAKQAAKRPPRPVPAREPESEPDAEPVAAPLVLEAEPVPELEAEATEPEVDPERTDEVVDEVDEGEVADEVDEIDDEAADESTDDGDRDDGDGNGDEWLAAPEPEPEPPVRRVRREPLRARRVEARPNGPGASPGLRINADRAQAGAPDDEPDDEPVETAAPEPQPAPVRRPRPLRVR